jgi:hypothetical protein
MIDYKPYIEPEFKVVNGIIPGNRMLTLFSDPFEIFTSNNPLYNAIIPITFTIRLNCTNFSGTINTFLLGNETAITAQLPNPNGAFCHLNNPLPDITPGTGTYTLGVRQSTQHTNIITGGVPVVLMSDADDLTAIFSDCPFSFTYYLTVL